MVFLKLKEHGCLVDTALHPVTPALIRWLICPFKIVTICMEKGARPEERLFKEWFYGWIWR